MFPIFVISKQVKGQYYYMNLHKDIKKMYLYRCTPTNVSQQIIFYPYLHRKNAKHVIALYCQYNSLSKISIFSLTRRFYLHCSYQMVLFREIIEISLIFYLYTLISPLVIHFRGFEVSPKKNKISYQAKFKYV